MRLLLIYNPNTPRCGVRNFGDQLAYALRRADHHVSTYDGSASAHLSGQPFYPPDVAAYDRVLLIWHPGVTGHYDRAPRLPYRQFALWVAEVPPYARCPLLDRAATVLAADPIDDCPRAEVLWYPVQDWIPDLPESYSPAAGFVLGWTGIRGSGLEDLRNLCWKHSWVFSPSSETGWLPFDDEVRRLARCTVNVCWYTDWRGEKATGASTVLGAGRPMVISHSPMVQHLQPYCSSHDGDRLWEIYGGKSCDTVEALEAILVELHARWQNGRPLRIAILAAKELSWTAAASRMIAALASV